MLEQFGVDVYDFLLPELIRLCAAYLDEGLAAWHMPARELGFYRAARCLLVQGSAPVRREGELARPMALPSNQSTVDDPKMSRTRKRSFPR